MSIFIHRKIYGYLTVVFIKIMQIPLKKMQLRTSAPRITTQRRAIGEVVRMIPLHPFPFRRRADHMA